MTPNRVIRGPADLARGRRVFGVQTYPVSIAQGPCFNHVAGAPDPVCDKDQLAATRVGGDSADVAPEILDRGRMLGIDRRPRASVPCPCVAQVRLLLLVFA